MSSWDETPASGAEYLEALLAAPRPGVDKILAFYDHRVGLICRDGRLLLVPLDDHLCHRGDGLFESICYREHKVFALEAHLQRLKDGLAALEIRPPASFEKIENLICAVGRAGGEAHGDLRVFISRGLGGFGVSPEECPSPGLYIVAQKSALPSSELYENGLTAFTSKYPPKQEYLATIKNTNYLPNVFMAAEALRKNMDIAITFDPEGHMGEAAIANIAIVDGDGCLRSPDLKRILPGVTLQTAFRLAAERMPVRHGPVHKEEIRHCREMLLFTSSTLCVAITHFDGIAIGHGEYRGKPGPTAKWLKNTLLAYMLSTGIPLRSSG